MHSFPLSPRCVSESLVVDPRQCNGVMLHHTLDPFVALPVLQGSAPSTKVNAAKSSAEILSGFASGTCKGGRERREIRDGQVEKPGAHEEEALRGR